MEEGSINLSFLLRRAFAFYKLKDENITRFVFTCNLFLITISFFLPYDNAVIAILYLIILLLATIFLNNIYLTANIMDFEKVEYNLKTCIKLISLKYKKLIYANFLLIFTIVISSSLIIPPILCFLIFLFVNPIIIEKDISLIETFLESIKLTNGKKKEYFIVFASIIGIVFLGYIVLSTFASIFIGTNALYIIDFMFVVIQLVFQRLIALLYINLKTIEKLKKRA